MKTLKTLLAVAVLAIGLNANAGLYLDPYFGTAISGDYDGGTASDDFSAQDMGLRLGWGMLGLSFGVDYRMTTASASWDGGGDFDFDGSLISAYVGYEFPIMIRVYGEYILSQDLSSDDLPSTASFDGASGNIIGIGYTGLPFVALNFEMVNYTVDYDPSGDADVSYNLFSVSFPFSL
jgi:hypothetical protein